MDRFFVIANESSKDSWVDVIWSDIKDQATIFLDNNTLSNSFLKKLKKLHFSNKLNKYFWIPLKSIWDRSLVIDSKSLSKNDVNIFIFQSSIKFSPSYIRKLKKEKNAVIILYLPDTISGIGIGNTTKELQRYLDYYQVDFVYSFDLVECRKYGFEFFDVYSKVEDNCNHNGIGAFYIGSCRNEERLNLLLSVFEKIKDDVKCDFNVVGVNESQKKHGNLIKYNQPLTYLEVIQRVSKSDLIVELVNRGQSGNTLRFKEAICYNKRIITNNPSVLDSSFYNSCYIMFFSNIDEIDNNWINNKVLPNYHYNDEYSPKLLLASIRKKILCEREQEDVS